MAAKKEQLYIWSLRFSPARGWHVEKERSADNERAAQMWLDVFRNDEPRIDFIASVKPPKIDMENLTFAKATTARKANPSPRKRAAKKSGAEADYVAFASTVKKRALSRPSQITKKAPSKRLVARRKTAAKKPVKGYFPNPRKAEKLVTLQIEIDRGNGWEFYTNFQHGKNHIRAITEMAKDAAQHAAKMNPSWSVRIIKK